MFYKSFKDLGEKGQVLILSYIVIAVFFVYSAGLLMKAASERSIAERNRLTAEAFYMAEGAIEDATAAFSSAIANFQVSPSVATFNWTTTFTTFGNAQVSTTLTRLEAADRLVIENNINVYIRNYEAVATAVHPENNAISVTLHQIVARRLIPAFQFVVFYEDDLEILPGPNMTIAGNIHSNEDMYLGALNPSLLTINSFSVRSAGDIYNRRKDNYGTVRRATIRVDQPGPPQYAEMAGLDSSSATWTQDALDRWQGTVKSSVHGVTELTAPAIGSIQPNGYYAQNADVVVTNNQIVKNGVPLIEGTHYPAGTVSSSSTFYNYREGKYIRMTTIDLNKLAGKTGTCAGGPCPNNLPSNGLLYATRDDAGGSEEPGIKLANGGEIDRTGGLTVVSNDPVYVKGDYNTVNEKPTSVIADSLNLLSNNWDDSKSALPLGSRVASATATFNCAFVAGVTTTTPDGDYSTYNGGLENYPRLHESWSGKTLNIKGSFVELWNSFVATGPWSSASYSAPIRSWQYNTAFNDPAKLPPFTPIAVEIQRVAWWND